MPRLITMATAVLRSKRRADMENDDSIAPSEWKENVAEVYGELCSEVTLTAGQRYFETSTTITADGSASYDEPSDHFSTVRIVRVATDGREVALRDLQPGEEALYRGATGGDAVVFAHVDDQVFLYPTPSSGTYKWYYRQQPPDVSNYADADVLDVHSPAGEAFLLWGVAALALAKGEKDVRFAESRMEKARERLQWEASQKSGDTKSVYVEHDDIAPNPGGWGY